MRNVVVWLVGLGTIAALSGPALAQDSGAAIAAQWCANCHATGVDEQRRAKDVAPTFDNINQRLSAGQIEALLTAPHEPMRGIDLTREQIMLMVNFITKRDR